MSLNCSAKACSGIVSVSEPRPTLTVCKVYQVGSLWIVLHILVVT